MHLITAEGEKGEKKGVDPTLQALGLTAGCLNSTEARSML